MSPPLAIVFAAFRGAKNLGLKAIQVSCVDRLPSSANARRRAMQRRGLRQPKQSFSSWPKNQDRPIHHRGHEVHEGKTAIGGVASGPSSDLVRRASDVVRDDYAIL